MIVQTTVKTPSKLLLLITIVVLGSFVMDGPWRGIISITQLALLSVYLALIPSIHLEMSFFLVA